jgi:hypothetical protein
MPESINAQLAVMCSAFSTATAAAKVPDGKYTASIGAQEVACSLQTAAENESTMIFGLQSNIIGELVIYSVLNVAIVQTAIAAAVSIGPISIKKGVGFDRWLYHV